MKRVFLTVILSVAVLSGFSCATSSGSTQVNGGEMKRLPQKSDMHFNPGISWIWNCTPVNGQPVFFASSGIRSNRDDEKIYCLQSAAIQAAQYYSMSGFSEMLTQKTTVYFGQLEDSDVFFNHDKAREMYEKLEIVEEFQDDRGTYVLATIPNESLNVGFTTQWSKNGPDWMFNIPQIPGYITSVGIAGMHRTFSTSVAAADKEAFMQLLKSLYSKVESEAIEVSRDSGNFSDTARLVSTRITSMGNIENFYIIARWRDKDMNYYSLAICPEDQ